MKVNGKSVATAVAVALMLSGMIGSPASAATKKPVTIKASGYTESCVSQLSTGDAFCEFKYQKRSAFMVGSGGVFTVRRGTEANPGWLVGVYTSADRAIVAAKKSIRTYTD